MKTLHLFWFPEHLDPLFGLFHLPLFCRSYFSTMLISIIIKKTFSNKSLPKQTFYDRYEGCRGKSAVFWHAKSSIKPQKNDEK